jgi:hypothetical protein
MELPIRAITRRKKEKIIRFSSLHMCKDPDNLCGHHNIYGHTKIKCWKLQPKLNPKSHKDKKSKKNNLLMEARREIQSSLNVLTIFFAQWIKRM